MMVKEKKRNRRLWLPVLLFLSIGTRLVAEAPMDPELALSESGRLRAESLTNFALATQAMGEDKLFTPKSVRLLIKALRADPSGDYPLGLLKFYWFSRKKFRESAKILVPLAEKRLDVPDLVQAAAEALIALQKTEDAKRLLKNSLDSRETWTIADLRLIVTLTCLYNLSGDYAAGEALYDDVLARPTFAGKFNAHLAAAAFFAVKAMAPPEKSAFPAWIAEWSKRRFQRKMEENLALAETAIATEKPSARNIALALELCNQSQLWGRLRSLAEESLRVVGENKALREITAKIYERDQDFARAVTAWEALSKNQPDNAYYLWELAKNRFLNAEWDFAREKFERYLKLKPNDPAAYYMIGLCQIEKGRYPAALEALRSAGPNQETAYYEALCHYRLGEIGKAIAILEKNIDAARDNPKQKKPTKNFYLLLAELYDKTLRREESERLLRDLLVLYPDDPDTLNFLGYALAERGEKLEEAETFLRRAVKAVPDNAAYLDSLAWVLYRRSHFREAAEIMEKILAAETNPDPVILDHAGDIQRALNHSAKALSYWKQALHGESDELQPEQVLRKIRAVEPNYAFPAPAKKP